jgi:transposase
MPVAAVARIIGEQDTRIWRVMHHYVETARAKASLADVTRIGVDETAAKRGHDYITLFMDLAKRRLMFAVPGRDHTTIQAFKADLEAHGGDSKAIQEACIDMSNAFIKGFAEAFPDTHLTFDRFHVMKLMGEAVDQVRRAESKDRPELKRTRWFWQRNPENPRAAAGFLEDWCELAKSTGLEPVMKGAQTLTSRPRRPRLGATAPPGTSSPSPTSSPASSTSLLHGPDRATHTDQRGTAKVP